MKVNLKKVDKTIKGDKPKVNAAYMYPKTCTEVTKPEINMVLSAAAIVMSNTEGYDYTIANKLYHSVLNNYYDVIDYKAFKRMSDCGHCGGFRAFGPIDEKRCKCILCGLIIGRKAVRTSTISTIIDKMQYVHMSHWEMEMFLKRYDELILHRRIETLTKKTTKIAKKVWNYQKKVMSKVFDFYNKVEKSMEER